MLKKLKTKFVMINMVLVGIVLVLVFAAVCGNAYKNARQEVSHALTMALEDTVADKGVPVEIGALPDSMERREPNGSKGADTKPLNYAALVVLAEESGSFTELSGTGGRSISMEQEVLEEAVEKALECSDDSGRLSDMSLFYEKVKAEGGWKIAFADAEYLDSAVKDTLLTAIILFVLCMAAMLLISLILAKAAVEPVKKAWSQQKQFVADASHELKTPLTVMLANSEILLDEYQLDMEREGKWVESTRQEALHMKRLVDDLLFLARSDEDMAQRKLAEEDISVSEVTAGIALQFEPVVFESGAELHMDIEKDLHMKADITQIKQLVHILLDNAVKYSDGDGEKGRIFLKLSSSGNRITLTVANTGESVPSEDLNHIFERFYRSDKARSGQNGFGLGLSIAKTIVENHDGRIKAESGRVFDDQELSGTKFTVSFSR